MPSSSGHILTSHAGSLPRPEDLIELNRQRAGASTAGNAFSGEEGFQRKLSAAVTDVVARQRETGIDLVNDGEYGHAMGFRYDFGPWWTYVFQRLGGPGVVSHSTNVVEHPELVADRIVRYAEIVGRDNVVASTDCGLGGRVHPQIAWAKLGTLASGAELATRRLWR